MPLRQPVPESGSRRRSTTRCGPSVGQNPGVIQPDRSGRRLQGRGTPSGIRGPSVFPERGERSEGASGQEQNPVPAANRSHPTGTTRRERTTVQLEAHAPSVPPSETIPPPGLTEDSTLIPLTALTALDDA